MIGQGLFGFFFLLFPIESKAKLTGAVPIFSGRVILDRGIGGGLEGLGFVYGVGRRRIEERRQRQRSRRLRRRTHETTAKKMMLILSEFVVHSLHANNKFRHRQLLSLLIFPAFLFGRSLCDYLISAMVNFCAFVISNQ
ncbi:unnamed protein product [Linum trigynum]|uniref:Secreted protein n=1 Tax=Linum trigynum TaxID=586398 RepID=A0AAV2D1F2_9ROSI